LALRAIVGIDPSRGSLIFSETIPEGSRVAFAVRDAHRARTDFQAQLASIKQSCAGSAPEFGIFVSCAGRGAGLYGSSDVDVRLIKKAFPNMPFAGMHSTFELAPLSGRAVPHIYTAAIGLFCRPS
jgi:small ligand-binding sensory domain FIST